MKYLPLALLLLLAKPAMAVAGEENIPLKLRTNIQAWVCMIHTPLYGTNPPPAVTWEAIQEQLKQAHDALYGTNAWQAALGEVEKRAKLVQTNQQSTVKARLLSMKMAMDLWSSHLPEDSPKWNKKPLISREAYDALRGRMVSKESSKPATSGGANSGA